MTETEREAERYVGRVRRALPVDLVDREAIVLELRGTIAERVAAGEPLGTILISLGTAERLAASYLPDLPLEPASHVRRFVAKGIDLACVAAGLWLLGLVVLPELFGLMSGNTGMLGPIALGMCLVLCLVLYPAFAERLWGRTLGKALMDLRVVRESGARISFGQAIVRQIPWLLQFFWVDVLFALVTERRQRAFEVLTKTRVIAAAFALLCLTGCVPWARRGLEDYAQGEGVLLPLDARRFLLVMDAEDAGWIPLGHYIDRTWSYAVTDTTLAVGGAPIRGRFSWAEAPGGTTIGLPDGRRLRLVHRRDPDDPSGIGEVVMESMSSASTAGQTWVRVSDMGGMRLDSTCTPVCYKVRGHTFHVAH